VAVCAKDRALLHFFHEKFKCWALTNLPSLRPTGVIEVQCGRVALKSTLGASALHFYLFQQNSHFPLPVFPLALAAAKQSSRWLLGQKCLIAAEAIFFVGLSLRPVAYRNPRFFK
jgi:hypothetical protein